MSKSKSKSDIITSMPSIENIIYVIITTILILFLIVIGKVDSQFFAVIEVVLILITIKAMASQKINDRLSKINFIHLPLAIVLIAYSGDILAFAFNVLQIILGIVLIIVILLIAVSACR